MQASAIPNPSLDIYALSEQALTVSFGNRIDDQLLQQVNRLNQLLGQYPFQGFCTAVPAYTTIAVFYDPVQVMLSADLHGDNCFERISAYLNSLIKLPLTEVAENVSVIKIPVCYGGDFGPDHLEVAASHHISADKVIELHSNAVYKVHMIGFVPGFAYLGGMPKELAMPRRQTPRSVVPAGSVGIAGEQTGIYPMQTPGGWQLIGRTPLKLFDASRAQPSLLKAGDTVIFVPIDELTFNRLLI